MRKALAAGLGVAALLHLWAVVVMLRPAEPVYPALSAGWMARLDTDGDGALSQTEVTALDLPGATSWDLDGDGVITEGELERMLWVLNPGVLY